MTRQTKKYSKTDTRKEVIITMIEDESENGIAFDNRSVDVLKKLTMIDLMWIQHAFYESYKFGIESARE